MPIGILLNICCLTQAITEFYCALTHVNLRACQKSDYYFFCFKKEKTFLVICK